MADCKNTNETETKPMCRSCRRLKLSIISLLAIGIVAASALGQRRVASSLSDVRAAMHKRFDEDKNGRLDSAERELMRLTTKKAAEPRAIAFGDWNNCCEIV